jgi:membrane protein
VPQSVRTARAAWKQASSRQAPLLAAGVAFYAFLSLFPAIIAGVLTYGLVASPATVQNQSKDISDALPADAASVVTKQLDSLTSTSSNSLGIGLVVAVVLAFYSASGGVGNLIIAINQMFDRTDSRGFLKRKALALALTVGAIIFLIAVIALVAVAPAVLDSVVDVPGTRALLEVARWALLVAAVVVAIGVLFRVAPDREHPPRLITRGVLIASLLWIVVSVGFSLYVDNFGSYGKTYGALAGVVVLLLWLWIGIYALLLGATIEALNEGEVSATEVLADREPAEPEQEPAES